MVFERCNFCIAYEEIKYFYDSHRLGDISKTLELTESFSAVCPYCKSELEEGDILISNEQEFFECVTEVIGGTLSEEIAECQDCNHGEILLVQRHGDPLDLTTVGDLILEWFTDDEIIKEVLPHIRCQTCNESIPEDFPYVTRSELDLFYGEFQEIFDEVFGITKEAGSDFVKYLSKNPMLGLNHDVGKEIFTLLKDSTFANRINIPQDRLYLRGRTRKKLERLVPFVAAELWNPPNEITRQGRYNPAGVSVLYLADTEEVIEKEIGFDEDNYEMDIGEFIIKNPLTVLDLSGTNSSSFSNMNESSDSTLKTMYLFPNFVMQCLLAAGEFNGILYDSVKGKGKNLCLFDFEKETDLLINNIYTYN
ncbi:RES family NAD+ phosphorylase [Planomicrobium sp. MB-3u-38]|uniref:RES family NAD+ phosphorylase n=1 Tax=Planomicrobium sp. MB-3u-38 TaxID=2058318 RepID=UPI000C7E017A|nr:RES family NAD+ phosphorylase [Planomicrobium sp. MB-3u-38]PKH09742.1 hypothetical protein CXF70_13265 [Planomicrobium sp. MB-3u-38]